MQAPPTEQAAAAGACSRLKPEAVAHETSPAPSRARCTPSRGASRVFVVQGRSFHVDAHYAIVELLGQGSYGIVCSAMDELHNRRVAIKKIERVFSSVPFTRRTLRELKLMRLLKHENLLELYSVIRPRDEFSFSEIYLVTELMDTDLSWVIRSNQHLSAEHVRYFLYQILRGLKFMHSVNVAHRDLTPRNLLVNSNCDLKICDLGLARIVPKGAASVVQAMTGYVAARWYRAPEVLVRARIYSCAVDIWAVGCVFAELLLRKPLFPGTSTAEQLKFILESLRPPRATVMDMVGDVKVHAWLRDSWTHDSDAEPGWCRRIRDTVPEVSPAALDLLRLMLQFRPEDRVSAAAALAHPYFAELRCEDDEPDCPPLPATEFAFEHSDLATARLKQLLLSEIRTYHKQEPRAAVPPPSAAADAADACTPSGDGLPARSAAEGGGPAGRAVVPPDEESPAALLARARCASVSAVPAPRPPPSPALAPALPAPALPAATPPPIAPAAVPAPAPGAGEGSPAAPATPPPGGAPARGIAAGVPKCCAALPPPAPSTPAAAAARNAEQAGQGAVTPLKGTPSKLPTPAGVRTPARLLDQWPRLGRTGSLPSCTGDDAPLTARARRSLHRGAVQAVDGWQVQSVARAAAGAAGEAGGPQPPAAL